MPTVEIGWRLDRAYWGQGLATEGGRAGLEFGFNVLGLDEIVSIPEPTNVASCRVAEHLGMHPDRETTAREFGVTVRVYKLRKDLWRDLA